MREFLFDSSGKNQAPSPTDKPQSRRPHVVALDYGMKWNIPRHLVDLGCRVTVVPGSIPAEAVLEHQPDGIFLSNGPGDPGPLVEETAAIKTLIHKAAESRGVPIFGICLGHQLLALATGGSTFKLPFGHRGANHPVQDRLTGKVLVTSQNHGFAVAGANGQGVTHVSLYDETVEGLAFPELRASSLQFHPEASPGPHDAWPAIETFVQGLRDAA
jgi:carbamoyl-phosphate synthase small subunit